MKLEKSVIDKIRLARLHYRLAYESYRRNIDISWSAAINLLHDSVEFYFLAIVEFLDIEFGKKQIKDVHINEMFIKIREKIKENGDKMGLKEKYVSNLVSCRNICKHEGVKINSEECYELLNGFKVFFDAFSKEILKINFWSIDLINLIDNHQARKFLEEAKEFLHNEEYENSLISCRKSIYVTIEKDYDISPYKESENPERSVYDIPCNSPWYCKNPNYIKNYVFNDTQYIVLDADKITQFLLMCGASVVDFWNIRRITPSIYIYQKNEPGYLGEKLDFNKITVASRFYEKNSNSLKEITEYVFTETVNIIFSISEHHKKFIFGQNEKTEFKLKKENLPIPYFKNASLSGDPLGFLPTPIEFTLIVLNIKPTLESLEKFKIHPFVLIKYEKEFYLMSLDQSFEHTITSLGKSDILENLSFEDGKIKISLNENKEIYEEIVLKKAAHIFAYQDIFCCDYVIKEGSNIVALHSPFLGKNLGKLGDFYLEKSGGYITFENVE